MSNAWTLNHKPTGASEHGDDNSTSVNSDKVKVLGQGSHGFFFFKFAPYPAVFDDDFEIVTENLFFFLTGVALHFPKENGTHNPHHQNLP